MIRRLYFVRQGPRNPKHSRGFSLIELMVVLAIMALLASIAFPMAELARRRGEEQQLHRALLQIRRGLDDYKHLVEQGRISNASGGSGYPPTLDALVKGVPDLQSPKGSRIYVMRSLPRDPFAPASIVDAAQTWGQRSYESPHDAPKAGSDVFDVYSLTPGNGLDGTPYREW